MDTTFLATNAALVPVIVGIVDAVKNLGMNSKYAGLLSIFLGLILSTISSWLIAAIALTGKDFVATGLIGILTGLSASGLYSQVKKSVQDNLVPPIKEKK